MKKILEVTGLKEQQVAPVVKGLSGLLADLQVYYSNLRGFHWNIRGAEFFVLHEQYEKMYDDLAGKIDEVAERILQLGGKPENRFSEYLKVAEVKEEHELVCAASTLKNVTDTLQVIMAKERAIAEVAGEAGDEVTVDLMIGFLSGQEKLVWMLSAYAAK
ncbi:DNA-binding ferritin-like protein (oxidative damage protectant) [Porphyromonas gingivalis AJW4]|uniref:Dps family protein n=1 Tax=Porphyromonas gingivalis TaxID=837 RepID=UPI0006AA22E3|nr:Dps family protein [Porphyromonas gingivalis]ALA92721.1 DNA-binding ferritin-like protein (oxidative damage protectant) [Porphyromonas gingivalis AJW4]